MISLLTPTRGRPDNVTRLMRSALETADNPDEIEFVFYIDEDDAAYTALEFEAVVVRGPRIVLSETWNRCYEAAKGPYYMHCGDDIIFRSKGWDTKIINAFPEDKIAFVHGTDGMNHDNFGTHGFLHKNWVEALGRFVPPYFSSDYNDTWLNDVANIIGRRIYVPDVLTEHMHPAWGKAEWDLTHQERLIRHTQDGVDMLYLSKVQERIEDANKLREVMK